MGNEDRREEKGWVSSKDNDRSTSMWYIVSVALHLSQKLCGFECFKVGWVLGHFRKEGRERERETQHKHPSEACSLQVSLPLQYRRALNHIDQIWHCDIVHKYCDNDICFDISQLVKTQYSYWKKNSNRFITYQTRNVLTKQGCI